MRIFCSIVILALILIGCGGDVPAPVMTKAMQLEVDSLYKQQLDSLTQLTDSICKTKYQRSFERAKDSIKLLRLSEIEEIINE